MVRKYIVNQDAFFSGNADSYYLLGAFMADGVVSNVNRSKFVSLYSKDEDWLSTIRNLTCPDKPLYRKRTAALEFKISDIAVLNWFMENGCLPNKSLTLRMPEVPEIYLSDFVRGYFDGDGSVSLSRYTVKRREKEYTYDRFGCYICSGSEVFIVQLNEALRSIGFSPSLHQTKRAISVIDGREVVGGGTWRISFGDRSAIKFTDWTHYPGHHLSMKRKFDKILRAREVWESK